MHVTMNIYYIVDREPQDNTAVIVKISQSDGGVIDSSVISLPSKFIFANGMKIADDYIVIRFVLGYKYPVKHLRDVVVSILTKDLEHVRTYKMIEPYLMISGGVICPSGMIRLGNELYIASGVPISTNTYSYTTGIYRLNIDDLKIFDAVKFTSTQYDYIYIDINKYMNKILLYGAYATEQQTEKAGEGIIGLADREIVDYKFVLYGEVLRLRELIEGTVVSYFTGITRVTPISGVIHTLVEPVYQYMVDNISVIRRLFVYGVVDPKSLLPPEDCGDFSEEVDISIEHYTPTYEDISDQVSVQPYTVNLVDADIEPKPDVELKPVRWCGSIVC